jgi:hypothetical protein
MPFCPTQEHKCESFFGPQGASNRPPDSADVPLVERASLPPSPSVPPVERCLACEADIEGVPGSGVWLRRTSREADFERVAAQNVGLRWAAIRLTEAQDRPDPAFI